MIFLELQKMVLTSILFSLFIISLLIALFQQSLKKSSLENKSFSQLCKIRHETFVEYKQAKETKLYGAMGYSAHKMVMIDKELSKRHLLYEKQTTILMSNTVEINNFR